MNEKRVSVSFPISQSVNRRIQNSALKFLITQDSSYTKLLGQNQALEDLLKQTLDRRL